MCFYSGTQKASISYSECHSDITDQNILVERWENLQNHQFKNLNAQKHSLNGQVPSVIQESREL